MVGIISVVIGGHFGGGDHFDGGDHFGGGTTFRFGSSKTSNSPSVDKPRQEPINAERATLLCPCNGVFIDQFIYRSILP